MRRVVGPVRQLARLKYVDPVFAVLIGLAVALRFADLGGPAATLDELHDHRVLELPLRAGLRAADGFPFLHALLGHLFASVVPGLAWQRYASAGLGVAAVLIVSRAASRIGGRAMALRTLALAAVAPAAVYLAREARPYGLGMFAAALVTDRFVRVIEHPDRRNWLWFTAVAIVLCGTLYTGLVFVAGGVAALLAHRRTWKTIGWFLAPFAVASLAIVLIGGRDRASQSQLADQSANQSVVAAAAYTAQSYIAGYSFGRSLDELRALSKPQQARAMLPAFGVTALVGLATIVGLRRLAPIAAPERPASVEIASQRRRPEGAHVRSEPVPDRAMVLSLLALAIVPPILGVALASLVHVDFRPRHYAMSLWPLVLVLGAVLSSRVARGVPLVVVFAVGAIASWNRVAVPQYANPDYRGVVAFLDRQRVIPVIVVAGFVTEALASLRDPGRLVPGPSSTVDTPRFLRLMARIPMLPEGQACSYLLVSETQNVDPRGELFGVLRRDFTSKRPVFVSTGLKVFASRRCADARVGIYGPAPAGVAA